MYKVVLIDKNVFGKNTEGTRYIDTVNLLECMKVKNIKPILIENVEDEREIFVPDYVKGIIQYSESVIKEEPVKTIEEVTKHLHIVNIKDFLLVSSNQTLIKLFEKSAIDTYFVNQDNQCSDEMSVTHRSSDCEDVKTLIYKQ